MKKHLSIFALAARATFHKVVLVLLLMMAAEIGMFYLYLGSPDTLGTLEDEIDLSRIYLVCIAAFAAISIILATFTNNQNGCRPSCTISRLSVKESRFVGVCALYNMCCFLLLIAIQILTAFVISYIYLDRIASAPYGPAIFLAFCRNGFLHGLLPLGDIWGLTRNIAFIAGMGFAMACSSLKQRRGHYYLGGVILWGCIICTFSKTIEYNGPGNLSILIALAVLISAIYEIQRGGVDDET